MKLDPRHLEMLAAIVDHGGLTEGAAALGKSQPSLSRTLAQLEDRIGAPLFLPGRRPLQPTELGRALADQGRQILTADQAASEIVAQFRAGRSGLVRLGGTPLFMDGVIASMIAEFQRLQPGIRLDQSYAYGTELIEMVASDRLDLAICPLREEAVPDDLAFETILPGLNVIACRAGHPLARRSLLKPRDIADYPWIAPPAESPLYHDLRRALEHIGATDFQISFTGGSLASVVSILTGSDALTVLPYSVVFVMRRQGTIGALSLKIGDPERNLGVLFADKPDRAPAARRLHAFLASQFDALSQRIVQHQREVLWRGEAG